MPDNIREPTEKELYELACEISDHGYEPHDMVKARKAWAKVAAILSRTGVVATVGVEFLPGFKDDGAPNDISSVAHVVKMLRIVSHLCPMSGRLEKDVKETLLVQDAAEPYTFDEDKLLRRAYGEKGLNNGTK